jgi:hypothetical protein
MMRDNKTPGASGSGPEAYPGGADAERAIHRLSRRSFLRGAVIIAAGFAGWKWLNTREQNNGIAWPFRRVLEANEAVARGYFREGRLAPVFPRALAREPKQNGDLGLGNDFNPDDWNLRVQGLKDMSRATTTEGSTEPAVMLSLDAIKALPKTEMVTELKCIEGWSVVVHWAGTRLADFIAKYPPPTKSGKPVSISERPDDLPDYVSLATPDGGYYVGLEMASALHLQTLLCYEMNGEPLSLEHGAPLRLVVPVKYGIKHIKRIGTLRYTDRRPADYWAEQGYDWYAGH